MRLRLLLVAVLLVAVGVGASIVMGSGPSPKWLEVADGAYQAALVCDDGTVVYVPASTRLRPPEATDDVVVQPTISEDWGTALGVIGIPPQTTDVSADTRQAFVYGSNAAGNTVQVDVLPGGWMAEVAGKKEHLQSISDRLDCLTIARGGQAYATYDPAGVVSVWDVEGEPTSLPGLPQYVLQSACAVAWSFDGDALYLAVPAGAGTEIWLAPLEGQARPVGSFVGFEGFVGATPGGVLVFLRGIALDEVTTTSGTRTVVRVAPGESPWVVSPDGRYVLWLDRVAKLTSLDSGEAIALDMPRGYELCPPHGWPGSSSSDLVVYACGRDTSDTVLLWYSEESPGRYRLTVVEPPTKDMCFDYSVDPVVVAPGIVSVVLTNRAGFLVNNSVATGTWLADLTGGGRR